MDALQASRHPSSFICTPQTKLMFEGPLWVPPTAVGNQVGMLQGGGSPLLLLAAPSCCSSGELNR